jgi:regulator of protease activity HflC (stomatin/prohibitin superfamily)
VKSGYCIDPEEGVDVNIKVIGVGQAVRLLDPSLNWMLVIPKLSGSVYVAEEVMWASWDVPNQNAFTADHVPVTVVV